jgi:YVTN family beta-propeller protein
MAFTQTGDYLYVTQKLSTVLVIRTSDNTITDTISVGLNPKGIAVSPDGKYVYVLNGGECTYCPACPVPEKCSGCSVSVILTSNNTVLRNIPMMNSPVNIALKPSGNSAYITRKNLITVIGFPD